MQPLARALRPIRPARWSAIALNDISKPQSQICLACRFLHTRRPLSSSQKPHNSAKQADDGQPDLPSHSERQRTHLSRRFSHVMDGLQTNLFTASQRLNDLTGYTGIESLKQSISAREAALSSARAAVQTAKEAYSTAIATRSASQREVNTLLQRRSTWSPQELERFTELYRSDHENEQIEQRAMQRLGEVEREAEEVSERLSRDILARYHEEQIWSDKIRRMSTWGTWGLMGVNVLLFLVFQVLVEPWRRARLVKGFDEKVREALLEGQAQGATRAATEGEPVVEPVVADKATTTATVDGEEAVPSLEETIVLAAGPTSLLERGRFAIEDLFSNRHVSIRKAEYTASLVGSAAAGAAATGLLLIVALRRGS